MAIITIIGQSGSGKSTLAKALAKELGVPIFKEMTTRPKRDPNDDSCIFITQKTFENMEKAGVFDAVTRFNAIFGDCGWENIARLYSYGITTYTMNLAESKQPFKVRRINDFIQGIIVTNPDAVIELDKKGRDIYVVELCEPTDEICEHRLLSRGDNPNEIERRIKSTREGLDRANKIGVVDLKLYYTFTEQQVKLIVASILQKALGKDYIDINDSDFGAFETSNMPTAENREAISDKQKALLLKLASEAMTALINESDPTNPEVQKDIQAVAKYFCCIVDVNKYYLDLTKCARMLGIDWLEKKYGLNISA